MTAAGAVVVDASTLVDVVFTQERRSIEMGIDDLDKRYGGLAVGALTVIGGRPGMGTTSLVRTIIVHRLRADDPGRILWYAGGETPAGMMRGLLAGLAKANRSRVCRGELDPADEPHVAAAAELLRRPDRLFIADAHDRDLAALRSQAAQLAEGPDGLQLIVVDEVHKLLPIAADDIRERVMADLINQLAQLATELDVAVLVAMPLRRDVDEREPPRPMMGDFIAAATVERVADRVMTIYRPDYYDRFETPIEWKGKAELVTCWNRLGMPGTTIVGFLGRYGIFVNLNKETLA